MLQCYCATIASFLIAFPLSFILLKDTFMLHCIKNYFAVIKKFIQEVFFMHQLQKAIIFSISFCIPSFAMIIPAQSIFPFNDLKDCKKNVIEQIDDMYDMRSMMQVNQECCKIVKGM